MGELTCDRCGTANAAGQRFCGGCGSALQQVCATCGSANQAGFRFCGSCGSALGEQPLAEPHTQKPEEAERRNATVLFADLAGFTRLSEQLDPEDVTAIIDRCMGLMGEIVVGFGGSVSRVIGDELMALFGVPVAHEDAAERAVRAALELQECAREHAGDFHGMLLRIGVNSGEALSGPVGPNRESTVMGDAVNVAKRLQTAGQPGDIVVGERTYAATHHAIRYEPMPPVEAKGKTEPVPAWRAVAAHEHRPRPVSGTPLVGRTAELDLLRRVWSHVESERRPHLVTVIGPPGIGKSRVAHEITAPLESLGVRVLYGRSLPYGESTGWGAFAQQIKQLAGILESDATPVAVAKISELEVSLFPDGSDDVRHLLPTLAGLAADQAAERGSVFLAARLAVEAIARARPTVFVFEDVHWADSTLLDLVEMLAARTQEAPALFLTFARPELLERRPNWGGGLVAYTALRLEPLGAAESARLLTERLHRIEPAAVERLVEIAGGNPLFLEELAATVSEHTAGFARELPTTVTDIIAARLDTLPQNERRVLLDASVVGKVFWRGALERMSGNAGVRDALDSLERKDLIRRAPSSRLRGDSEYVFKHMLIREVAYRILPKATRRERHRAAARFIESAAGGRLGESASLLAHHWREAGDDERAIEYLITAARHAAAAWAKEEAISLYSEALDLIPADDAKRRRSVIAMRARERVALGDFEGTRADLGPILDELEGHERLEAMLTWGRAAFWLFRTSEGAAMMEIAAREAERAGETGLQAAALGTYAMNAGSEAGRLGHAVEVFERALKMWPEGYIDDFRATIVNYTGLVAYWRGDYEAAVEHSGHGYRLSVDLHAFEGVVNGGANYGMALAGAGRHEEAIALFERVLAAGREYGATPRFMARARNMLSGTLRELLETDEATRCSEAAIELARLAGFAVAEGQASIDQMHVDLLGGDFASIERRTPVLREAAEKAKGFHEWLISGRMADLSARIALAKEDYEAAAAAAADALAEAIAAGRLKYEVSAHTTLARALLEMKQLDEARTTAERALAGARKLGHPPSIWQAAATRARIAALLGRDDEAVRASDDARATLTSFAASLSDERRERFLAHPSIAEIASLGS